MLTADEIARARVAKRRQTWILGGGLALSAAGFFVSRGAGATFLLLLLLLGLFGGRFGLLPDPARAVGRPLTPEEKAELETAMKE